MRPPTPALAAIVSGAAALSACGGSGDEAPTQTQSAAIESEQGSVLATIDALQTASRKGDGATICGDLFTRKLVRSIESASRRSCPAEVQERLFDPDASFSVDRDIETRAGSATAQIREDNGHVSTLHLVKIGDAWTIDRVTPEQAP